ncbi:MAG TPA: tetratricopeptide repeat protein, partial [Methylomirabilota bacterium]|nr:tetratricopeptide repeat protein [Methylomirabilota bacterium]
GAHVMATHWRNRVPMRQRAALALALLLALDLSGCATGPRTAARPPDAAVTRVPDLPRPADPPAPPRSVDSTPAPVVPTPAPAPAVPGGPGPDGAARARAEFEEGQALIIRGELARAIASLRSALRLQPDFAEARVSLGLALYGAGDLDGAIDELRALLRTRPDLVPARLVLASALMARRDWSAARAELEEALARRPDSLQAYYSLGFVRYALGDLAGAIAAYRSVLARQPEHHDARYNLALVLRLAGRDAEATAEFVAAAEGGVPRAQYFAGAAYATGVGVERDLGAAIAWWFRASEHGVAQADEALAQMRQTAQGRGRSAPGERRAAEQAFLDFRASLWGQFPDLARDGSDSAGTALLRSGRAGEAVPVLIREALALSEPAERLLERAYEQGADGVAPHDPRILGYFGTAAAEGRVRARLALARIHALGLGVPADVDRAIGLLEATPHEDAQRLLRELSAASGAIPARP